MLRCNLEPNFGGTYVGNSAFLGCHMRNYVVHSKPTSGDTRTPAADPGTSVTSASQQGLLWYTVDLYPAFDAEWSFPQYHFTLNGHRVHQDGMRQTSAAISLPLWAWYA